MNKLEPKFYFEQEVKIVNGFYRGRVGVVVDWTKKDDSLDNFLVYIPAVTTKVWIEEKHLEPK